MMQTTHIGTYGTLLVFMACDEGVLACGDNTSHTSNMEFGETEKIFTYGEQGEERCLYAAAGLAEWGSQKRKWAAPDRVRAYLECGGMEVELDGASVFGDILQKDLGEFLRPLPTESWPKQPTDKILLEAVFVKSAPESTAEEMKIQGERTSIFYDREQRRIWSESSFYLPFNQENDRIVVLGVREIYDCLLRQPDPQLLPYCPEPALQPLLSIDRFNCLPTLKDAKAAALRLIEVASNVAVTVGKPAQCFLVRKDGSIEALSLS